MDYPKILSWFIAVYPRNFEILDITVKYIVASLFHIPRRLA
jgi:hypothetical protein